ncbi:hypothetical protein C8J57DRAFT_1255068 [Mycena rebaudengoi]|nr:hypothetical protein C8J57DRAFT_1255068 [Mycena rebaudengoi]
MRRVDSLRVGRAIQQGKGCHGQPRSKRGSKNREQYKQRRSTKTEKKSYRSKKRKHGYTREKEEAEQSSKERATMTRYYRIKYLRAVQIKTIYQNGKRHYANRGADKTEERYANYLGSREVGGTRERSVGGGRGSLERGVRGRVNGCPPSRGWAAAAGEAARADLWAGRIRCSPFRVAQRAGALAANLRRIWIQWKWYFEAKFGNRYETTWLSNSFRITDLRTQDRIRVQRGAALGEHVRAFLDVACRDRARRRARSRDFTRRITPFLPDFYIPPPLLIPRPTFVQ